MMCHYFSLTDPGRVRTNNEDALAVRPEAGLVVLADGMGGYNAGEVASQMVTDLIARTLGDWLTQGLAGPREVRLALKDSVTAANLAVYEAAQNNPSHQGMATTLVVAVFGGARLTVGHVGDSRLYRLRQGQLATLTRDHSLVQEQVDAGLVPPELARTAQYRNLVTRAVGVAPQVELDVAEHVVLLGDTYLFCSDGLNDMLPDGQIEHILKTHKPLEAAGQALLTQANQAGGRDNISLVLVQCAPQPLRGHPETPSP